MRLIVVRHGQTNENRDGVCQGQSLGTLSDLGVAQAEKLGERLKDVHFDVVYSSDLERAANTMKAIMQHHSNIPVHFSQKIRERAKGSWEGMKHSDVDHSEAVEGRAPGGGENWPDMFARAEKFLHELLHKHKDQTVLVVAHAGFNNAFLAVIQQKGTEHVEAFIKFKNTSVTIVDIDEDKNHEIHLLDCVKHLE